MTLDSLKPSRAGSDLESVVREVPAYPEEIRSRDDPKDSAPASASHAAFPSNVASARKSNASEHAPSGFRSLTLLSAQIAMLRCRKCARPGEILSRVVPGRWRDKRARLFVVIAPGPLSVATRHGIPFSGDRSGILLRAMISRACLDERVHHESRRSVRATAAAALAIHPRRNRQLQSITWGSRTGDVNPGLIACLGSLALAIHAGRTLRSRKRSERPAIVHENALFDPIIILSPYSRPYFGPPLFARLPYFFFKTASAHGRLDCALGYFSGCRVAHQLALTFALTPGHPFEPEKAIWWAAIEYNSPSPTGANSLIAKRPRGRNSEIGSQS